MQADRRSDAGTARRQDPAAHRLDPREPLPGPAALRQAPRRAPAPSGTTAASSIFTENREGTKRYLKAILEQAIEGTDRADERIEVIDGLTSGARRKEIQRRFNTDPAKDPLRILLATDAAREGLNFQAHCADLFHFDLPWNPGRIEQRNGRIDRKLQPAPEVRCHYFVLPQRVEDRVLEVLVRKTETIKKELGSLSKVIDDDIERRLGQGIRHRDAERAGARDRAGGPRCGEEARHRGRARGGARAPGRPEGADRALPDPARGVAQRGSASRRRRSATPSPAPSSCSAPSRSTEATDDDGQPSLDLPAARPPARRPTRAGPRPSTPSARRASRTRSSPTGAARRRSGRSSSRTRACSPRTPSTCTSSSGSPSACSPASARRASSTTTSRAPASRRPPTRSRA